MKKRILFGALCVALALSFLSCSPAPVENEYVKIRSSGSFSKIPEWLKGYWSDSEAVIQKSDSYFFTDTNIFQDWMRKEWLNLNTCAIASIGSGKTIEEVSGNTYTVTFGNWYDDDNHKTHTNKDWVLKFAKTSTGFNLTETEGDTVKDPVAFTKGRLFLPTWLRNTTWKSEDNLVTFTFSNSNLIVDNNETELDYTTDMLVPYVDGYYCEYKNGTGYIEESNESSYKLTVTDGEDTIVTQFYKKDDNTITWINGGETVGDLTKQQ